MGEQNYNIPSPEDQAIMQQAKEEAEKRNFYKQKVAEYFPQFGNVQVPVQAPVQGGFLEGLLRNAYGSIQGASNFLDDLLRKDNERWQGPGEPFPRDPDAR